MNGLKSLSSDFFRRYGPHGYIMWVYKIILYKNDATLFVFLSLNETKSKSYITTTSVGVRGKE
jgi:hypothetical protein